MALGSLVDNIITGGQAVDYRHELFHPARAIAAFLTQRYPYIHKLKKQVPCVGDVTHAGLTARCKTLIDFVLPTFCAIDLKVTDSKDFEGIIKFMGYDNQVFIEKSLAGVPHGYLLMYSTAKKLRDEERIYFKERQCAESPAWLANKILEFGTAR
jgi:hypothetical protein